MGRYSNPNLRGKLAGILLAAAATALIVFGTFQISLHAQEPSRETAKPAETKPAQAKPETPGQEVQKEVLEERKEGSETDALRNSPVVVWIARHTGLSNNAAYWLCVILNFAIVFFSIALILRKMLPVKFRNRTALIQQRMEEARKTSEEASRRLSEVEGRLARLDLEIAGMRREADENAQAEEKRVLAGVAEERRRIVESAEQEIAMAANSARRDLKAYAAELAVDLAEKKIKVAKDTDQSLVREFTANLGKDGN
ncbi:MAG TPA: ATP synthase F0 subunit B [Candidatus Angelobacter sp.]|nr:ATP synthase F0 subunit B [Candidatus Angelobacter sp.]